MEQRKPNHQERAMRVIESCIDALEEEPAALADEHDSLREAIARLTVIEGLLVLRGNLLETGEDFGPGGLSNL